LKSAAKIFFIVLIFFTQIIAAQKIPVIKTVDEFGIALKSDWKFISDDDIKWSLNATSDDALDTINTKLLDKSFKKIGWFRYSFFADSLLANQSLSFIIMQTGASEIYVNGSKIYSIGKVSANKIEEIRASESEYTIPFYFVKGKKNLIAIRFSNCDLENSYNYLHNYLPGIDIRIVDTAVNTDDVFNKYLLSSFFLTPLAVFFISLALFHLLLFLFYRKQKSNLYFFAFAFTVGLFPLLVTINTFIISNFSQRLANGVSVFLFPWIFTTFLILIFSMFTSQFPKRVKWIVILSFVISAGFFTEFSYDIVSILLYFFITYCTIESIVQIVIAIRKKKKGYKVIGLGMTLFVSMILIIVIIFTYALIVESTINLGASWIGNAVLVFSVLAFVSMPVTMSVHLAQDFALTNITLEKKLLEVEQLSVKTIEQEKEKQKILATHNEMLEVQVRERTAEIVEQKKQIEEKNKDITDSINYAKKIQAAILPQQELKKNIFPNSFVLFKPKDIVSGDFYWYTEKNGVKIIAAADCTGHGVPGALMSMVGNNILNQIVNENGITDPAEILKQLHIEVRKALKQENEKSESKDGMDIALLSFVSATEVHYAGANRPLWLCRKFDLTEHKPDKISIGGLQTEEKRLFTNNIIQLEKNDCLYIFSDGFADQFGGDTGKKFMTKNFKQLLTAVHDKEPHEQEKILESTIDAYRGSAEQIDDILVIGVKF
jgi:serine phosphatase RsbU (regulator of sigma subunit)